jgi:hypothetical protein
MTAPAGGRTTGKLGSPWCSRGIFVIAVLLADGRVLLGTRTSDVRRAGQFSGSGVPATATVAQDRGRGRYAIRVSYATVAGQQEQGTLDPRDAADYPAGSPLRGAGDPASPSVVTPPGSGASAGGAEAGAGAFIPAPAGRRGRPGLRRGRHRARQQAPAS